MLHSFHLIGKIMYIKILVFDNDSLVEINILIQSVE